MKKGGAGVLFRPPPLA